ncbi:similar to Esophagus cancer-related gene-2 protein precursor (ECRG-2) (predicted), isoform CRA_a [Rattus norvegicus]|uniref:Serine peptidase inhibitor, Kazal type 8 n=3 Tax=Rattus norvegicus TaxID=10116 RepID=D3ZHW6_RAT|nr:serine protease inhibitor Kazal-type 8 [Rattus norvegicus]XP_008764734.1 serine protease inhibitor Kazal-type 8 isoform X1 [Rattus norvegicus]XP_017451084.1 serine protease inhibitor Kazal-type 8 isoform X1 [Rattus norvegicus]XP_038937174.1 serine protease inhibitor Kazal-type 8 isoform X1 [Rattus norvegicus]EDL77106.1 similar to Esophagus cancer-related gene-2 protein precursor (ECRG-2) (predicted), isoform CRA_a [Rattus norvegicus]|eukprot:NP_001100330.1 serine protease inhibitor Kazal-type 8 [Rattus norvegicus]
MKVTFSVAVLVLAISVWTSFAVDFFLPMGFHTTEELLKETKALCVKNVQMCWILTYFKLSEPICGSNQVTYNGECHLCSEILFEDRTIIKVHDGPCETSSD